MWLTGSLLPFSRVGGMFDAVAYFQWGVVERLATRASKHERKVKVVKLNREQGVSVYF